MLMAKFEIILNKIDASQVTSVNYAYWKLGTTLTTVLLLLTAITIESAVAVDNVVSENQDFQLSSSENLKASSIVSGLNSQQNLSLRQRLLESKKSNPVVELDIASISDSLTANVKDETFSNIFSGENFLWESQDKLKRNDNLEKQLFGDPISNPDLSLKKEVEEQTNLLEQKKSQILVQIDSSSSVGDSFGEVNKLRQELLIEPILTQGEARKSVPGSTAGTPSAYGASLGQAYIGGGLFFPL